MALMLVVMTLMTLDSGSRMNSVGYHLDVPHTDLDYEIVASIQICGTASALKQSFLLFTLGKIHVDCSQRVVPKVIKQPL